MPSGSRHVRWYAQWRAALPSMSARRCIPVCLTDIPFDVRVGAAREACAWEEDVLVKQEVIYAALFPSERIYWVAP